MKKVYTIVLFERSVQAFHHFAEEYIHYGKVTFDKGLELELLQEYCLVALDVFRKIQYPKGKRTEELDCENKTETERIGWLKLLTTETVEEAEKLIEEYPWLESIYQEAAMYRQRPEEVLLMYSEALKILDRNTVKYMIEELERDKQNLTEALAKEQEERAREQAERVREQEQNAAKIAALERKIQQLERGN